MRGAILQQADQTGTVLSPFRPSFWDWIVFSVCLVLGSFGVWSVYEGDIWGDFWRQSSQTGRQIGTVERQKGSVRLRNRGSIAWFDLGRQRQDVRGGDAVFTGSDGTADLALSNQASIEITPGSLVVISDPQELFLSSGVVAAISVDQGSVRLKVHRQKVSIKINDYVVAVNSPTAKGELELKKRKGSQALEFRSDVSMALEVRSQMNKQIKSIEVQPGHTTRVSNPVSLNVPKAAEVETPEASTKREIQVESPANDQTIWAKPGEPIQFKWHLTGDTGTEKIRLWIKGPSRRALRLDPDLSEYADSLAPGAYSWGIDDSVPETKPSTQPKTFQFYVAELKEPRATLPLDKARLATEAEKNQAVRFTWEYTDKSLASEVEIFSKTSVIKSQKFQPGTSEKEFALPPGEYQWRLRSLTPTGKSSDWSTSRELTVIASATPKPAVPSVSVRKKPSPSIHSGPIPIPKPKSPVSGSSIRLKKVTLDWSQERGVQGYEVKISTTKDLTGTVFRVSSGVSFYAFEPDRAQTFFWRVRGVTGERRGEWSHEFYFHWRGAP